MRSISCASVLLAAAAALAPSVARAEDAPAPAEVARKALAALAPPSEKHAYTVDVDFFMGGSRLGSGAFSAAPEAAGEKTLWRVTDALRIGPTETPQVALSVRTLVGADLHLEQETREETDPTGTEKTVVARTEKGLHVTHTKGGATEEKDVEAAAGTLSGALSTLVLFLRQVPAEAAEYEVSIWDGDDRAVGTRRLSVKGVGRMKDEALGIDAEALWAVGSGGRSTIEIYVDPKDRAFLGARIVEQGIWLTKQGLVRPKEVGDAPDLTKPADSAKGVGAKFVLGILTSNAAAIEASIHWSSMAADQAAKGMAIDEAMLKSLVMGSIQANMQKYDMPMAWGVVKGALDGAQEKPLDGGVVQVKLGAPMQAVTYSAKSFEGLGWMITAMEQPGSGGGK